MAHHSPCIDIRSISLHCSNIRRHRRYLHLFAYSIPFLTTVVGSCPSLPIYAGEIQTKSLGMAVEVYSTNRSSSTEASQPGELVCTMPFPSMPLMLWGDRTGEIYRKAYFDKFPGVWHHGDYMAINTQTKGIVMIGRRSSLPFDVNYSDGVLNPAGVRVLLLLAYLMLVRLSRDLCRYRTVSTDSRCHLHWTTAWTRHGRECDTLSETQCRASVDNAANHRCEDSSSGSIECTTCTQICFWSTRYSIHVNPWIQIWN